MGLLVEAHERCRGPEDAGEPALDRDGFKRLVRDLDLWCSSCMVASEGRDPVGVLLGAKRAEATLVYALRVHPEHRRRGHGRHLLTSLGQKLAILGPPRLVAEVPADREAARAAFAACGWTIGSRLTDWRRQVSVNRAPSGAREALAPVSVADLEAAGLLATGPRCWQRDLPALEKHKERLSGLAFHSPDRIEAWALWSLEIPPPTVETPRGASPPEVPEGTHGRIDGATAGDAPRGVSTVEGASLLAVGCAPGALGRLGLSVVLDEIGAPLLLPRATPEELDADLLAELGFESGPEHLLFTSQAQAAVISPQGKTMRTYSQIQGDGGSDVAEQITELEAAIARRMAGIRHVVAVGSGKGGVGKSTLTRQLGAVLAAAGKRVGILDADLNGPSQAMLNGVRDVPPLPGDEGLLLPVSRDGLKVLSVGSLLVEGAALTWPSASPRHTHVWRATRELAKLAELLAAVHWGPLDMLLVDLPPGPERTAQFADFLGPQAAVLLVSIPSALARGVVARSVSALSVLPNRLLGHVENMSGYACAGCGTVRPLFPESREAAELALPCLGRIPFDPQLAALSDEGRAITELAEAGAVAAALAEVARNLIHALEVP